MPGQSSPRPKTLFRKIERVAVGIVMTIMALVLERVVMRSIRKGGGDRVEPESTTLHTSGAEVDLDP